MRDCDFGRDYYNCDYYLSNRHSEHGGPSYTELLLRLLVIIAGGEKHSLKNQSKRFDSNFIFYIH